MSPHSFPETIHSFFKDINIATPYEHCDYEVVCVVDPFSTGYNVVQEIKKRGHEIIALEGRIERRYEDNSGRLVYLGEVERQVNLAETKKCVGEVAAGHKNVASLVGAESGVDLVDALSEYLGSNPMERKLVPVVISIFSKNRSKRRDFDLFVKPWVSTLRKWNLSFLKKT